MLLHGPLCINHPGKSIQLWVSVGLQSSRTPWPRLIHFWARAQRYHTQLVRLAFHCLDQPSSHQLCFIWQCLIFLFSLTASRECVFYLLPYRGISALVRVWNPKAEPAFQAAKLLVPRSPTPAWVLESTSLLVPRSLTPALVLESTIQNVEK